MKRLFPAALALGLVISLTPSPVHAAATPTEAQLAREIAADINAERAARGLSRLPLDSSWSGGAQRVAESNRDRGCHPCHSTDHPGGEVVYYTTGFPSGGATNWWMGSTSHRNLLMSPDAVRIGVGVACNGKAYDAVGWVDVPGPPPGSAASPVVTGLQSGSPCGGGAGGGGGGSAPATTTPPVAATRPPAPDQPARTTTTSRAGTATTVAGNGAGGSSGSAGAAAATATETGSRAANRATSAAASGGSGSAGERALAARAGRAQAPAGADVAGAEQALAAVVAREEVGKLGLTAVSRRPDGSVAPAWVGDGAAFALVGVFTLTFALGVGSRRARRGNPRGRA